MSHARYCWLKHDTVLAQGDKALASAWKTKALEAAEAPGFEAMPSTLPAYAKLVGEGARYVALPDLEGATEAELVAAGLTSREAAAVLAAFAALP